MGRYRNTGLARGTFGSPQRSKENYELEKRVRLLGEELLLEKKERERKRLEQGIREFENAKVKFKKEDVLFVTRDKTGQLIWLEKGNDSAGLEHILKHKFDFYNTVKIKEDDIPEYLRKAITYGVVVKNKVKMIHGRQGYERVYKYDSKYYILAGIGLNGFVVSAYPTKKYRS